MRNSSLVSKSLSVVFGALLLSLVACGGGGSDGPAAPAAVVGGDIEFQSFDLVNSERRSASVDPQLGLQAVLSDIARQHSEAMRDQGFFGHQDNSGRNLRARLKQAGVSFRSASENLAKVDASSNPAAVAHRELMASQSHRSNILGDGFNVIGVGVAQRGNTFWITQVFVQR